MESCLSVIAEYNMTADEAVTYKLCCMYDEIVRRNFPSHRHYRSTARDPRKTILFKYCYKLYQDNKARLALEEFVLYIQAQMDVFKALAKNDELPLIDPSCLVGERAWMRWLVWKRRYDKKKRQFQVAKTNIDENAVRIDLRLTKKFLNQILGKITESTIDESVKSGKMAAWINRKQVSPYFFLCSKWKNQDQGIKIDLNFYKNNMSDTVMKIFDDVFSMLKQP